jgi:hypothetical protein
VYLSSNKTTDTGKSARHFPLYGSIALVVCLVAWACSWLRIEPFSPYSFFPLWLGYILFVDALVVARHGTSLLLRMHWRYVILFGTSSLFWWLFEFFNIPVQNWHYTFDHPYSPLNYFLFASLNFSTVLPAVLETTELLSTFKGLQPRLPAHEVGPRLSLPAFIVFEIVGVASLVLPWVFPHYFFPLVWFGLTFLLDPINNFMGHKSTYAHMAVRDWRFFVLPLGALVCGFFWEMWNFYSLPKWYYTVPFIGFWKVFEMPLLGFTGYLPFALELFAFYQFVLLVTRQKQDYLVI